MYNTDTIFLAERESGDVYPLTYFEGDEYGKEWARGYTQERRDTTLINFGTNNGIHEFDIGEFIRNLYDTVYWRWFNPKNFDLEARQEKARDNMRFRRSLR